MNRTHNDITARQSKGLARDQMLSGLMSEQSFSPVRHEAASGHDFVYPATVTFTERRGDQYRVIPHAAINDTFSNR